MLHRTTTPFRLFTRRAALRAGLLTAIQLLLISRHPLAAPVDPGEPFRTVQNFDDALLSAMKAGSRTPFPARFALLAPSVDRTFDLDQILRMSVGPQWMTFAPGQQSTLRSVFRDYTIANFAANFDSYSDQRIEVLDGLRRLPSGDQIVETHILRPGREASVLAYVMRPTAGQWKAVDMLAGGTISRIATQRSDFRTLLTSGGASGLAAALEAKISALSGGSVA